MPEIRRVSRVGRPVMRGATRSTPGPSRPRKSRRGWLKPALVLAALVIVWQYFLIDSVEVKGVEALDAKAIELAAEKGIDKQLLGENLITLSSRRLERSVIEQIPEIKSLAVTRKWPQRLIVTVNEREPSLAWQSGGDLYLLDRDGTVIREISGKANVAVIVDTTNLPVRIGSQPVPERFVIFSLEAMRLLKGVSGGIKQVSVIDTTSELNMALGDGYSIKLDTTREAGSQVRALKSVLAELSKQGKKPSEYVDLRIEGKAYYK